MKLFKKSFALYVESGIKKKTEAGLDILRKELKGARGHSVTVSKDFKEKFYMFIMEQYLREFHCFYIFFALDLTMIFCPNTAHPEDHHDQAYEWEQTNGTVQENKKKFTWLQNSLLKIRRGLGQRV